PPVPLRGRPGPPLHEYGDLRAVLAAGPRRRGARIHQGGGHHRHPLPRRDRRAAHDRDPGEGRGEGRPDRPGPEGRHGDGRHQAGHRRERGRRLRAAFHRRRRRHRCQYADGRVRDARVEVTRPLYWLPKMDLSQIRELLKIVAESGVAEVEIEEKDFKLVVRKNGAAVMLQPPVMPGFGAYPYGAPPYPPAYTPAYPPPYPPPGPPPAAPPPAAPAPAEAPPPAPPPAPEPEAEKKPAANEHVIPAPIVGTFYRSPSPDQPAFVEVGDTVERGEVLCIIEAMKLMNEIESDVKGVVRRILVDNAQPVEYDQPLFVIEVA